jgi:hypothetical protein
LRSELERKIIERIGERERERERERGRRNEKYERVIYE